VVLRVTSTDRTSSNVVCGSGTHKCVGTSALPIALLLLAVVIGEGEERAPRALRLLRLLNTPKAVIVVLGIVLIIDGLLFCLHELSAVNITLTRPPLVAINPLTAVESSSLSSPEQTNNPQLEALTVTLVLIAVLIIGVINVIISCSALRSARKAARLAETSPSYASEDR
jgi:hypothetical protein